MFTVKHKELGTYVGKVRELPHNPSWRYGTAVSLLTLNYPELRIAEIYKALLLIQLGLFSYAELGESVRLAVFSSLFNGQVAVSGELLTLH